MTKQERHLWCDFLKLRPFHTHRQKVFGQYIVDFYIASAKIVIELDGSQHYAEEHRQKDQERDRFLQSLDILVLRYSNADITNALKAYAHIRKRTQRSPCGEGGPRSGSDEVVIQYVISN